MGFQLVGRQRKACFHRGYPCVDNQSDGDPLRRIAKRVGKPTGALASKALSQVVKKDKMTSVTAKPTTTSALMMIHSIKFMISVGYTLLFYKQKVLVGSIESVNS